VKHLSAAKPSNLLSDMSMGQVTPLSKPFLLTRALSTAALLFGNVHGLFSVNEPYGNVSLSGGDGKHNILFIAALANEHPYRYSLLPALSLDGIIHAKIVEGSFTTVLFRDFIEGLLDRMQPFPAPNSVIIMDNAHIHKNPRIVELIEERYIK
jgi:hypothetical protein